jgi:subtilisin family serine protease
MSISVRRLFGRLGLAIAVGLLAVALLLATAPMSSSAPSSRADKVDAALRADLAAKGSATFWIDLVAHADLSAARSVRDWDARGTAVMNTLRATADASQAGVLSMLAARGVAAQPFWISNTIRVTGDAALADALAARSDVRRVRASTTYSVEPMRVGTAQARVDALEWNIDRVNANDVWSQFGVTGQGVVVANIDTGVLYNHPALVAQYRGTKAGGGFNHNWNWFDPSEVCGNPSVVPCDNEGHGSHTMGTMVGDDGGTNQIGVAPGAKWIAAKGCETNFCSDFALLSSAQWILAPTRLDGTNPRPHKRPNVVNNSWGGGSGDPWYQDSVDAWIASGIFPQFSNGNFGPSCGSASSPGDYPATYSAGAFDINNVIASFSARGPSQFGQIIKPNIAAPGVNVRSAWNNGNYFVISGTSMASPHVAGTVALLISAVPSLRGDIDQLRSILDQTATDTAGTCGGTNANNNTWGQGKLDAFAAVDLANG